MQQPRPSHFRLSTIIVPVLSDCMSALREQALTEVAFSHNQQVMAMLTVGCNLRTFILGFKGLKTCRFFRVNELVHKSRNQCICLDLRPQIYVLMNPNLHVFFLLSLSTSHLSIASHCLEYRAQRASLEAVYPPLSNLTG